MGVIIVGTAVSDRRGGTRKKQTCESLDKGITWLMRQTFKGQIRRGYITLSCKEGGELIAHFRHIKLIIQKGAKLVVNFT